MKIMKNIYLYFIIALIALSGLNSCKTSETRAMKIQAVKEKPGSQLWAENCVRCHYAPSPSTFSDREWELVGLHMQTRANLTHNERVKIVEFLKESN